MQPCAAPSQNSSSRSAATVRSTVPGRSCSVGTMRLGSIRWQGSAPPPGSATQVEALLVRLEELESHVAEQAAAEKELKAINLALVERLAGRGRYAWLL